MGRAQRFFRCQAKPFSKNIDQCRIEGQRTAFKNNWLLDVQTLSKAADGLLGNGVEGGQRQVLTGNTLIQQWLDICLGINTTAAGNIINAAALGSQFVEFFHRHL